MTAPTGLRHEDLTDADRALLRDPELAAEHERELELGQQLALLPDPEGGPTLAEVRAASGRRRRSPALWGGLALAAAALLAVQLGGDDMRNRGVPDGVGHVSLRAVAEGPDGRRALADGDAVRGDERVLFRAVVDGSGHVVLTQDGAAIHPISGRAEVQGGPWVPRDGGPLSWRPDDGRSRGEYRVWLCPEPSGSLDGCRSDGLVLHWTP